MMVSVSVDDDDDDDDVVAHGPNKCSEADGSDTATAFVHHHFASLDDHNNFMNWRHSIREIDPPIEAVVTSCVAAQQHSKHPYSYRRKRIVPEVPLGTTDLFFRPRIKQQRRNSVSSRSSSALAPFLSFWKWWEGQWWTNNFAKTANDSALHGSKLKRKRREVGLRRCVRYMVMTVLILLVLLVLYFSITTVVWLWKHLQCFFREASVQWTEGLAHTMSRPCPKVPYRTLLEQQQQQQQEDGVVPLHLDPSKICLTTLSDSPSSSSSSAQRQSPTTTTTTTHKSFFHCRDFDHVAQRSWPNQQAYAKRHGYLAVDQSALLDDSRPPAWSKIRAVLAMFQEPYLCDWVLWMDADAVIMNSSIPLESIIPADPMSTSSTTMMRDAQQFRNTTTSIDLIVTTDRRFTANSGVWMIRNTPWSIQFLNEWWNLRSYVRSAGLSLSGDNDAFGHLVRQRLGLVETVDGADAKNRAIVEQATLHPESHIRMPARCTMNSFGVFIPLSQQQHAPPTLATSIQDVQHEEWYLSDQWYHAGDFIAHASGIDQKSVGIDLLLARAT